MLGIFSFAYDEVMKKKKNRKEKKRNSTMTFFILSLFVSVYQSSVWYGDIICNVCNFTTQSDVLFYELNSE